MDATTRIRTLAADKLDFAPGILKLQEAPPSPFPRVVLRVLLALLTAALGHGRRSAGSTSLRWRRAGSCRRTTSRSCSPPRSGVVKGLLVREGDLVKGGQILARMDMRFSEADRQSLRSGSRRAACSCAASMPSSPARRSRRGEGPAGALR